MPLVDGGRCHRRAGGTPCCAPLDVSVVHAAPRACAAPLLLPHRSISTLGGENLSTGSRLRKRSLRTGTTAAETSQVGVGGVRPGVSEATSGVEAGVHAAPAPDSCRKRCPVCAPACCNGNWMCCPSSLQSHTSPSQPSPTRCMATTAFHPTIRGASRASLLPARPQPTGPTPWWT